MFCPQCGQKQLSNDARFCSGCGLPLNNVAAIISSRGQLPASVPGVPGRLTPRQKGVRQGAMLMLSTIFVVPLVAILGVALLELPGEIAGLAAVICFIGGLLRLLYALLIEENYLTEPAAVPPYVPPALPPNYLGTADRGAALPPAAAAPAESYRRPRYDTGELAGPPAPSVTDHTTRLLDREPPQEPRDPK